MHCNNVNQTICQFNVISPVQNPRNLGSIKSADFTVDEGNVILTYSDPSGKTQSAVTLVCSKEEEATFFFTGQYALLDYRNYKFQLQSKHFCHWTRKNTFVLSTGTIICIVRNTYQMGM
ncbi:uncharacterized protein LOC106871643 isoform X2 [Octopus bimaculoides]|uniref:uncharacterized protein LOC106871643 isoform X2 n=1 Tax=Octopus bimaculoides TaxID=37653 RepID=UPI00071C2B14|nr:uncharacterized protein LOC106871643 isoform X2 [Octopus bimaculoides]|eukprot:XP_014773714.1 PREDICTED: uncharacterized protein LOC106871643 isoform X2 [Octopus bimaculoides]